MIIFLGVVDVVLANEASVGMYCDEFDIIVHNNVILYSLFFMIKTIYNNVQIDQYILLGTDTLTHIALYIYRCQVVHCPRSLSLVLCRL